MVMSCRRRYSGAPLLLFLTTILLIFISSEARFFCGLDPVTNLIMEVAIKLDCRTILSQHEECCTLHGFCYLRKTATVEECDNQYCACLIPLSQDDGKCKFHGDNFCNYVKTYGHLIYPVFTIENGKR